MSEAPELLTPRLRLRAAVEDDAAGPYLRWMNDPEVTRYLESRFGAHTEADLRAFVASARRSDGVYLWAIELQDGARHVGNIKLGPVDERHGTADIGLLLGERDVWGKGIATEAIDAVSSWALDPDGLGLRKATAGAYAINVGSIKAFEKAGFHVEAVRRAQYVSDGEPVDGVLLARFAS